ncbi:MAG: methane monooxygenase/ammonia monooxygenase subunit A [Vitreoscilla sp.]|jgi:methane/ammonia monooxygenase subunit A|nr:methane monooxygenase/ammonia monooxygenase subunit A [Vitreoscilla sp.]
MGTNDRAVLDLSGLSPQSERWSRTFDLLIVVIAAFLVWAVSHINFLLFAGDWDFFIDWKDRQYWVLIYPISVIVTAAAFQAIFWHLFRLPIGATASMLLLLLSVWIVRYHAWEGWAGFPLSLVVPGTCLMGALALDALLVITRSWVLTGAFGGVLFAMLFYPSNWPYLAPYFLPVEHMGSVAPLADLIGYTFPRTATPEYIRIIERGNLRTFENAAVWVSSFFAGFICIFMYWIFWQVGVLACRTTSIPVGQRFKAMFAGNDVEAKGVSQ